MEDFWALYNHIELASKLNAGCDYSLFKVRKIITKIVVCLSTCFAFFVLDLIQPYRTRGWCPKFATGLNIIISHSSKSVWVIKLSFCQNDLLIEESFWQNNRLVTHIFFELWLIMIFSPVANFGHHPLASKLNAGCDYTSFKLRKIICLFFVCFFMNWL